MCAECRRGEENLGDIPRAYVDEAVDAMETMMHPGVAVEPTPTHRPGLNVVMMAGRNKETIKEEVAKWGSFPMQPVTGSKVN